MTATVSIQDILTTKTIGFETLDELQRAAGQSNDTWADLRAAGTELVDLGAKSPGPRALGAYALYLLGRRGLAIEELTEAKTKDALGCYVLGRCLLTEGRPDDAKAAFTTGAKADKTSVRLQVALAETERERGDLEAALQLATKLAKKHADDTSVQFEVAAAKERLGEYDEAMDLYEAILAVDPEHAPSLFRLAIMHEQRGGQEVALACYERLAELRPTYGRALINYGLLLEDLSRDADAVRVYQQVLAAEPDHEQAALFLKDAQASIGMYYDEEQERRSSRQMAILRIPVTDFELSVRARNCLNKMDIRNLGDLVTKTEEELLAYKNFGETSLHEIKQMLAQKGLRLGMFSEDDGAATEAEPTASTPETSGQEEVLAKPASELELSVRARNCMERLNIRTIGEICQRGESELLAVKNFGQTSLNEVKQKLAELGLTLRA